MFKTFFKTLFLLPYGKQLLRPTAAIWIFFMSVLALSMATIEGIVWAATTSLILPPGYFFVTIAIGVFVGVFIWIFDASLVTLDLSKPIYQLDKQEKLPFFSRILRSIFSKKLGWGIATRLLVLAASILITAPLLGQIFLEKEIERRMEKFNSDQVASLIQEKQQFYDQQIFNLEEKKQNLEEELKLEISGQSNTKSYGYGPVARTIDQQLQATSAEIERLTLKKESEIDFILSSDPQNTARQFGLETLKDNFETRHFIQETLRQESNGYTKSELLAAIFLGFIFVVMSILKIFQGKSVEIYYNDQLQELYDKYQRGYFNDILEPKEHPTGEAAMSPYRFHDWIYNTFVASKELDLIDKKTRQAESDIDNAIKVFDDNEVNQGERIGKLLEEQSSILKEQESLTDQIRQRETAIRTIHQDLAELPRKIKELEEAIKQQTIPNSTAEGFKMLSDLSIQQKVLEEQLGKNQAELEKLERQLTNINLRFDHTQSLLQEEQKLLEDLTGIRHRAQVDQLKLTEEDLTNALKRLRASKEAKTD